MAIKKLQNNFTTPEQSKRLLELGVPADSADCHYINSDRLQEYNRGTIFVKADSDILDFNKPIIKGSKRKFYIPCWSVGRLIEIFLKYSPYKDIAINESNIIEQMIESISMANNDGLLDFSKLED